ncbi:hypothetical protein [Balneola vulgaris]|uniref:hypothetical protein n=1 Tax=Balneola vulgaris TaxID=287535 RepID=UPI0003659850|nr:hypothetical protein [Balneola vulgaris]
MLESSSHINEEVKETNLNELTLKVKELIGNPLSVWAVAATIESLGIRDIDAKTDFGFESVFDLAKVVFTDLKTAIKSEAKGRNKEEKEKLGDFFTSSKLFVKHYGIGLLFTMPMLSQIAAILFFEYALWAWFRFNEAQATMIAIGTISSFVLTGGFIQVLGRLVSKYIGEDNYYLCWKAIKAVLKMALPMMLFLGAAFYLLNLILPLYPQLMVTIGLVYYVLISTMLLSAAVLYASGQKIVILISIVTGTLGVAFGMEVLDIGIYVSQWAGILLTTLIQSVYCIIFYSFKIRTKNQKMYKQSLPKAEVSFYTTYRYYIYGLCYFSFLFIDRVLAWSAGIPPPPYIIWFNTPYELGMDWALISLIVTVAALEFSIQLFSHKIMPAQKKTKISNYKGFNKYFNRFYNAQVFLLLIIGVISIIGTYYGVMALRVFEDQIPEIKDFFANPITFKVYWIGSIGYFFLVFGLLNSLFFFTMNRPEFVIYPIIIAILVNGIVGFLCSRLFGFEYAVIGLVAGSFAFAFITWVIGKRFFKHLDYFYYSAY